MAVRMFDLSTPDTLGPQLLANLGNSFLSGQKQAQDNALKQRQLAIDEQKRAALAGLSGIDLTTPEGQQRAASTMLQQGDPASAAQVLGLGATLRKQASEEAYNRQLNNALGLGGGNATAPVGGGTVPMGGPSIRSPGVRFAETEQDVQRLEAEMRGETQFGDRNQPRGLRNNNAGNIEAGNFAAGVPGYQGSDGRFAQFRTPEQGILAADKLLQSYAGRGLNTVSGIVNRWAPPNENNTGAYAASVAKELGVSPDQPLDMGNPETRRRLIQAKIRVENGSQPYGEEVFQRAYGGGSAPQPVQTAQAGAVRSIPGDDPVQLRRDAEAYRQSNPEAARQLLARAEAAERQSGPQMAQAGGTQSDVPQGAPAQGVVIPGQGNSSLPPGDLFPGMTTEQLRLKSMTAPQGHPAKPILDAALKARMEWERGAEGRSLDQENKRLQNQKLQREVQGENAPTVRQIKQADGSEVAVQWDSKSGRWVPLVAPEGGNPVANPKLTEQQSKDVGFFNRAQKILPRLEQQDQALTDSLSALGGAIPLAGNFFKGDLYRQAEQTGRELLAVILRKDTGAAVTDKEMDLYGNIYLPKPGDDASTIQQKRDARKTAIEGIRMGLGTADIVIRSREALQGGAQPGQPQEAPKPQAPAIKDGAIAVNPTTGERILFRGGKWVPAT